MVHNGIIMETIGVYVMVYIGLLLFVCFLAGKSLLWCLTVQTEFLFLL